MLLCLNFQIFDSLCKKIDFLETLRMLVFCHRQLVYYISFFLCNANMLFSVLFVCLLSFV